jgi:hypothetical protein
MRSGIWWWPAVLGGDNCHSGGPVQHAGFVGSAPGETQSGSALLLLGCSHFWSVGFISTWIECPFLSVALLRRLKTGFKLLGGRKKVQVRKIVHHGDPRPDIPSSTSGSSPGCFAPRVEPGSGPVSGGSLLWKNCGPQKSGFP